MSYLVRSWNVYHGRTHPPGRRAHLEEAVQLAARDGPDILCLQEVPVWGVPRLGPWSGMTAVADVTAPARLGPLPLPRSLSRRLTDLHHGVLRSAFAGQANAVLLGGRVQLLDQRRLVLNDRAFRGSQAQRLALDRRTRIAWGRHRRLCQAVRAGVPDGRTAVIVNLHASHTGEDGRVADAELARAVAFAEELASAAEIVVLAGDFNVTADYSPTLAGLAQAGFSSPGPGIDHILVRGAPASALRVWPEEARRLAGRLLSDHAPVELVIE